MKRMLWLVGLAALGAGCSPVNAGHGKYAAREESPAVTEGNLEAILGGVDPTSISGRVKPADETNIQHPKADGNDEMRPPDGPGAPANPGPYETH